MRSQLRSRLGQDRFLTDSIVLTAASMVAGLLGFGLHSVLSHQLRPSDYGAAFAVISLQSLLVPACSWVGLVVARVISRAPPEERAGVTARVLRTGNWLLLGSGTALALLGAAISPFAAPELRIPPLLLVAGLAGVPFLFAAPLLFGALQGAQRFGSLGWVFLLQAGLRLAGAVVLGAIWGAEGAVIGVTLAALLTYLVVLAVIRADFRTRPQAADWRAIGRYSLLMAPSAVAQALLLTTDVELVKHFFSPLAAGQYSVVAVLGRAIYWGALSIAIVLFPKIISRERIQDSSLPLVAGALGLAVVGGGGTMLVFSLWGRAIITAFAGPAYAGGSAYIGLYSLAMVLLGAATVLITVHQSRARPHFLWILVAVTALEPVLIGLFHSNLLQAVLMVDASMALLLIGMAVAYLFDQRRQATSAGAARVLGG